MVDIPRSSPSLTAVTRGLEDEPNLGTMRRIYGKDKAAEIYMKYPPPEMAGGEEGGRINQAGRRYRTKSHSSPFQLNHSQKPSDDRVLVERS